jgi:hypothetical protein
MNPKWVCIVSAILLLIGIPTGWPYSYYILLRWIICAASIYVAYRFYKSKITGWAWIFGSLALLFNPVLPFYLNKSTWVGIDLISSILYFVAGYSVKKIIT